MATTKKHTDKRHEFTIVWVYNNQVNTKTAFFPCTSIAEVLKAFSAECIILSCTNNTLKSKY